jgi:uncharacterized metal-binding protein YceD (DUF177 family)
MFGLYYRALMASELPEQIECRQLAAGGGTLSGGLPSIRLARIDEPYRVAGETQVELRCHHRDGGGYQIEARIAAPLEARCQRCLEWTPWPVNVTMELVAFDKAPPAQDHGEVDSVELVDGMLPLREVIEDEVLLSCPFAPLHALKDCPAGESVAAAEISHDRKQPFAGLADLLKSREPE